MPKQKAKTDPVEAFVRDLQSVLWGEARPARSGARIVFSPDKSWGSDEWDDLADVFNRYGYGPGGLMGPDRWMARR